MASKQLGRKGRQIQELREIFDRFDKNGSDTISSGEMQNVFKVMNISDREKLAILNEMDKYKEGINFETFKKIVGPKYFRKFSSNELYDSFKYFDKDNSGFISSSELKSALDKMGKPYTSEKLKFLMNKVDEDHNGKLNIDEFSDILEYL